jgi:hypothetical protein
MKNAKRKPGGVQITRAHNPRWPLALPGTRERSTMKKKTKNTKSTGSQSRAKNSKSTALVKFQPKKNTAVAQRSTGSFFNFRAKNPLSHLTKIGGVSIVDIGVAGITMLVVQGLSVLLPGSPGSWMQILSQAGVVVGLVYIVPQSIKTPVAIGGGSVPVMNAVNKVTNNAIPGFISSATGYAQGLVAAPPAPPPQQPAVGMGAYPRAVRIA